jgi:hypothetical protein
VTTTTDTCWADPLTRSERRELARKLANACHRFASAPEPRRRRRERRRDYDPMAARMARRMASAEMSDLHLDVTERAEVPAS